MELNCVHHQDRTARARCVSCGEPKCVECRVRVSGRNYCRPCVPGELKDQIQGRRSPALASVLSAVPGLGQMYAGRGLRGITFLAATAFLGAHPDAIPAPIPLFLWVFNLFDAYSLVLERNAQVSGSELSRRDRTQRRFFGLFAGIVALFSAARMIVEPSLDPSLLWPAGLTLYALFFLFDRKEPDVRHA